MDEKGRTMGLPRLYFLRTDDFLQSSLPGMPQRPSRLYPADRDARKQLFPADDRSIVKRPALPGLLFSGRTLPEPLFPGYGRLRIGKGDLYGNLDKCPLPERPQCKKDGGKWPRSPHYFYRRHYPGRLSTI